MRHGLTALLVAVCALLVSARPANHISGLDGPENLVFDQSGTLYITDTNHLWKVLPDKSLALLYTRDPELDSTSLAGIVSAPDSSLIFSTGSRLLKLSPDGGISEYARGFKFANGLAIDPAGNVFAADSNAGQIVLVTPDGQTRPLLKVGGMVNGLKYDPPGRRLCFTTSLSGKVACAEICPKLRVKSVHKVANLGIGLDDLALDSDGNFYVCQYLRGKVVRIDPEGGRRVIADGIKGPSSLAFVPGGSGRMLILEKGANLKFTGTSVLVLEPSGN